MNKNILAFVIALFLASSSYSVYAVGTANAGKTKAASCAGCHGEQGNSMMPMFPKIAGQHPKYVINQLLAFKEGTRKNATMAPMAMGLSNEDMADIAAFYAEQQISSNELPVINQDDEDDEEEESGNNDDIEKPDINALIKQGSDLYRNGDLKSEVSACIACHGPSGEGNKPAAFPALRSQHADYLIQSLSDYKSGARVSSNSNMMHMIAKKMSDEEIRAVSYYISMMK